MNAIELSLFSSRIEAVCEEMGAALRRAAFSPNIRDRLDFSCAVFDPQGELCAQAAHIPVHLGSMAFAMRGIVRDIAWQEGDMVVVNDPYLGGTHLPDVTVISPLFARGSSHGGTAKKLLAFVANRAHHANIGGHTPGSMPISSTLEEEGVIIPPTYLLRGGRMEAEVLEGILAAAGAKEDLAGDFAAQVSANKTGLARLGELVQAMGMAEYEAALVALNDYAERIALSALAEIPVGRYEFEDLLDDDGLGNSDLRIRASVAVADGRVHVDFVGTAPQTAGNVNCPLSVAAAGVYYVFRCLMPKETPACAGAFRPITLAAPEGSFINARPPAAVAAGNVETSTRIVDVILGALAQAIPRRIPAASHGTMNNVAMGSRRGVRWDYYETIGGGMGAGHYGGGLCAVQTHMTNTLNTPVEVLESTYPVRVARYAVRRGSGGAGRRPGGDGIEREYLFLASAQVTLLTERRRHAPWGLAGGAAGAKGENWLNDTSLPPKVTIEVRAGDRLTIQTPGGGGYGSPGELP